MLFWGILGAFVTRGVFILVGAALLRSFHWVMYLFGVFLVLTAVRMLFGKDGTSIPSRTRSAPVSPL